MDNSQFALCGMPVEQKFSICICVQMVAWSNVRQCHEMFCRDPNVMGSNPNWIELGGVEC